MIDRLDNLIRRTATGCPEALAELLGISRSGVFDLITFLKEDMHAPIYYNRNRCSYMYSYIPKFYLGFEHDRSTISETNTAFECSDNTGKNVKKVKVEIEIDENPDFVTFQL